MKLSNPLRRNNPKNFFSAHQLWKEAHHFERKFNILNVSFHSPLQERFAFPSTDKRKEYIFRTLKIRKNSENLPSTSFGDIDTVLNEKNKKIKKKAPKIKRMRQKCHHMPDFQGFF